MSQWRLFNARTRQQIVGLSSEQALKMIASADPAEQQIWFVWRPGYSDWMKAVDCRELRIPEEAVVAPAPPALPSKPSDRRKHERISMHLKVVVVSDSKTFRAYSRDVSEGGLSLDKKIPWSLPGKVCLVYISEENGSDSIGFKAKVLSTPSDPFRLSFEEVDERFLDRLKDWIVAAKKKAQKAA